jgi:hypothetical protein
MFNKLVKELEERGNGNKWCVCNKRI